MFGMSSKQKFYVVDNVVSFSKQEALYEFCKSSLYRFGHSAATGHPTDLSRFVSYLTSDELRSTELDSIFFDLIKDKYGKESIIDRSYINIYFPYTPTAVHTDDCDSKAVTAIFYMNHMWHIDWAGETQFYDDKLENITHSVIPKGGRVVVFDSSIPHAARAPSVLCPIPRYTLTIKGILK